MNPSPDPEEARSLNTAAFDIPRSLAQIREYSKKLSETISKKRYDRERLVFFTERNLRLGVEAQEIEHDFKRDPSAATAKWGTHLQNMLEECKLLTEEAPPDIAELQRQYGRLESQSLRDLYVGRYARGQELREQGKALLATIRVKMAGATNNTISSLPEASQAPQDSNPPSSPPSPPQESPTKIQTPPAPQDTTPELPQAPQDSNPPPSPPESSGKADSESPEPTPEIVPPAPRDPALDRAAAEPLLQLPAEPLQPAEAASRAMEAASIAMGEKRTLLPPEHVDSALQAALTGPPIQLRRAKGTAVAPPEDVLRARENYDIGLLSAGIKDCFRAISRKVIGRETLLAQTLYALLTREHQLIYSRAGLAKSLYASTVFGTFSGAKNFSIQLTKGTTEEGIVGGIDLNEMKKGNIMHNIEDGIVRARFAFLDEIFDANDVALRSLLGILNERLFRKGKQQVDAVLHTAIATSNYVRATEITEAIIDRFPFRAYLMPSSSPYDQLRIDEAYAENTGKLVLPDHKKIPFEHIEYLADVVEFKVPGKTIDAPWHVLFLKNAIVAEYMRLVNDGRKKQQQPELYVSPRTSAKTRDILNAHALLQGRTTVTAEDLASLKYMICTLGDSERQEDAFEKAYKSVISGIDGNERDMVDVLMEAHDLLETVLDGKQSGKVFDLSFFERIKAFFGLTSVSELSLGRVRETIARLKPTTPLIVELHRDILARIDGEIRRSAGQDENPLYR